MPEGIGMIHYYSSEKLTRKILDDIDFCNVIYAEITPLGGMGNAGGVILYSYLENHVICYETNIDQDETTYAAFDKKIALNKEKFLAYYGGMGNYVFINKESTIKADDEKKCFVFVDGQNKFQIDSSSLGVYKSVSELMIK